MRAVALGLALTCAAGCGRIGYEAIADDDSGDVDAAYDFVATPCEMPVLVADLGAPAATPPARYALDVAVTDTGMVAVYQLGDAQISATGIAVDAAGGVANIQTRGHVVDATTADFSAAAIGDLVQLAVDDETSGGMTLYPLSEVGYGNGTPMPHVTKKGRGHDFITADRANSQFIVTGVNGTDTYRFIVDEDGNLVSPPVLMITGGSLVPEGVGTIRHGLGYAVFAGTTSECTVAPFNEAWVSTGPARTVAMTCHNMSLASAPASSNVIPSWNCDNDQVWTTAGDLISGALPPERSVYGDSTMSASDPRVAATPDGTWFAYTVAGGRLGRTLLDATGASVPGVPAGDVYSSSRVVAHDLVARDGKAFLLWLEHGGGMNDELRVMRLCTP